MIPEALLEDSIDHKKRQLRYEEPTCLLKDTGFLRQPKIDMFESGGPPNNMYEHCNILERDHFGGVGGVWAITYSLWRHLCWWLHRPHLRFQGRVDLQNCNT